MPGLLTRAAHLPALLLAFYAHAQSPCVETLAPKLVRELPAAQGLSAANDVSWLSADRVLIGAQTGVLEYSIPAGTVKTVIGGATVPAGLPMVNVLDTDGTTVVASNLRYADITYALATRKALKAQDRPDLLIFDVAVRGKTVAVVALALLMKGFDLGTLWVGETGAPWKTFKLLRAADPRTETVVRSLRPPYGGSVIILSDGSIAAITPAEPGIVRYRADGSALPTLGASLRELTIPRLPELVQRFKTDIPGRYQTILNAQPLADDLVETPDGVAIVVRRWSEGRVWWELWFPDAHAVRRRIRLGVDDRRGWGGHMRCDTLGSNVACIFSRFTAPGQPGKPNLATFDLARVQRPSSCR